MQEYPLRLTTFASSPKGTPYGNAGNFIATAKSRPLGEGGIAAGDDGRGTYLNSPSHGCAVPAPSRMGPLA